MEDFENLKNLSETDIYLNELREFEKLYKIFEERKNKEMEGDVQNSGKKKIIKKKK